MGQSRAARGNEGGGEQQILPPRSPAAASVREFTDKLRNT